MIEKLTAQLRRDEGTKATAYQDHLGFWTIGVGRLIDSRKPGAGLRPDEIDYLLRNDINDRVQGCDRMKSTTCCAMTLRIGCRH